MALDDNDELIVQKQATVKDILDGHMAGMSGLEIANKYGIDSERVKEIIRQADEEGRFIPPGESDPVDKVSDSKKKG